MSIKCLKQAVPWRRRLAARIGNPHEDVQKRRVADRVPREPGPEPIDDRVYRDEEPYAHRPGNRGQMIAGKSGTIGEPADPEGDDRHPGRGAWTDRLAAGERRQQQHEHRSRAARDRIGEIEVAHAVCPK